MAQVYKKDLVHKKRITDEFTLLKMPDCLGKKVTAASSHKKVDRSTRRLDYDCKVRKEERSALEQRKKDMSSD